MVACACVQAPLRFGRSRHTTSLAARRRVHPSPVTGTPFGIHRRVQAQAIAPPLSATDAKLPSSAHGFDLIREEYVSEYGSRVGVFKHSRTGAECMSVSNSDENKTFGVVFRTPVDDSTGIPHILEHSVLNGSKKYPVKEPFVELIKGSLHTFINAFTYPDRTCYPVASTNLQVRC
jgi:presequence protease